MNALAVAILCTRGRSVYRQLPGCDCYDAERDARTFVGGLPVVAHPPCRLWAGLVHLSKPSAPDEERELGVFCARKVAECGGVLEHPARSRLFRAAGLPHPGEDCPLGFTLDVDQFWWGHLGRKRTWLFVSGVSRAALPPVPFRLDDMNRKPVEFLSGMRREATPPALAEWLVTVARLSLAVTAEGIRA